MGPWGNARGASDVRHCATTSAPLVEYVEPVLITVGIVTIYYAFLFFQTYSKLYIIGRAQPSQAHGTRDWATTLGLSRYRYHEPSTAAVKYGNTHDPLAILGDRCVGNTLEQLVPFLVSLWLYALTVGPHSTRWTGCIYLVARALYPWAFWRGSPAILLSTVPGYCVVWYHLACATRVVLAASLARDGMTAPWLHWLATGTGAAGS